MVTLDIILQELQELQRRVGDLAFALAEASAGRQVSGCVAPSPHRDEPEVVAVQPTDRPTLINLELEPLAPVSDDGEDVLYPGADIPDVRLSTSATGTPAEARKVWSKEETKLFHALRSAKVKYRDIAKELNVSEAQLHSKWRSERRKRKRTERDSD